MKGSLRSFSIAAVSLLLASSIAWAQGTAQISLQGFRTYVQTGIVLQVNANPVINAVLAVGNLLETVSVEGAAPLVDVRSAGIREVVDQQRIVQLGRSQHELECGHVWKDHDPDGRFAHHAVRHQVRFLTLRHARGRPSNVER
jgi:hypothetical protein